MCCNIKEDGLYYCVQMHLTIEFWFCTDISLVVGYLLILGLVLYTCRDGKHADHCYDAQFSCKLEGMKPENKKLYNFKGYIDPL